ncbi:MAG: TRAP transporter substrate-binding protein DctP [Spirochaetales bacterium]|nr:TRAP transporter substrate-binding protein DctP [Spirochaetales bacterium]
MMKRVLLVLLTLVSVFSFFSCGSSDATDTAVSEAPKKVIKWKLQSWASAGDATYEATVEFARMVEEASDGRLVISTYNAGAIIPAGKEFDAVIAGTVEAVHGAPGWSLGYFPGAVFYNNTVGGLTCNQQRMWLEYEGLELARKNYEPLGVHYVGRLTPHNAEVFAMSTKPLNSVEDLKGFKVRMGSAALNEIFARMGAAPVFMPGGEVYEATQRGIIDGFEYVTPSVNWGMGFQEVADYMYLSPSRAPTDDQALFVNLEVWNELPADLQVIVTNASFAVAEQYYVTEIVRDAEALISFEQYGTKIQKVPADIEALLSKTADAYYAELAAADPAYKEIYDSVMEWKKICNQFNIQ